MRTISQLGEWKIIAELARRQPMRGPGLIYGIGDDASVLAPSKKSLLVTTDLMQEGVHFEQRWAPWDHVGYKVLQINASDIAAMGGKPLFYWLALSLPPRLEVAALKKLKRGLDRAAREIGLCCAGGDTNRSPRDVVISVTLIGEGPKRPAYRSGARVGDAIFVSGRLGEAALGLKLLQARKGQWSGARRFCLRQTKPQARLTLGQALVRRSLVGAMIDLSDGLASDLGHILEASGVGADIKLETFSPSAVFSRLCSKLRLDPIELMLSGGEDYELLFTAPVHKTRTIHRLGQRLGIAITQVGHIVSRRGLSSYDETGNEIGIKQYGYEHFKKS